ncbi:MAG: FAD-binding oxidoreductase, partial [Ramlibacter sp.]|nr:FAD-binding oxidoreductase [Ramlibacter sp.]
MAAHFHTLEVKRVTPDAAGSAAITLQVPAALRDRFDYRPGQFVTLRATIEGRETRRSYSICSPRQRYLEHGEIDIGVKPVEEGVFSVWALAQLRAGRTIEA